jgi:uncharacterized protein
MKKRKKSQSLRLKPATVKKSRKAPEVTRKPNGKLKILSKSRLHGEAVVRLRRANGHLEKVIQMTETGASAVDILQQLSAVVAALGGCRIMLFNGHMKATLRSALRGSHEPMIDEIEKLASRLLKLN